MEIKEESAAASAASRTAATEEKKQPLLEELESMMSGRIKKKPKKKAIRRTFKISAHLSNLLPTGSVLTFQILSPALTNQGECPSSINRYLTLAMLGLCALSCFLLSFTDSFRDERGKVRYGVATSRGLWVIDGSATVPLEEAEKYRVKLLDYFHAVFSTAVFVAVAMFDKNVANCFFPAPSEEVQKLLVMLPLGVGVLCSFFFTAFPTKRHGIGFPLSKT